MKFLIIALLATAAFALHRIKDQHIVDQHGLKRIFHGVNVVYKLPPYYPPILDHFDPNDSLADVDFENLVAWGMKFIRLHVSWEGAEAVKGQYNYTYFEQLKGIVQRAAKYDITILLDAHQDVLSRFFCGEGFPDWAVSRQRYVFPFPLAGKFDLDENGYPLIEQCLKRKFASYYFAFDTTQTFQDLFDNKNGVADSFAQFWGQVANYFKDEPNVIGYEIINEPLAGVVYKSILEFIWPHRGNNHNLLPLYQRVNAEIRKYDQDKLLFFEPGTSDYLGGGFSDSPGGLTYRDREVYSYHIYCPLVDDHSVPTNAMGCHLFDNLEHRLKEKAATALGVGKFLTEFGAIGDEPKGNTELNHLLSLMESTYTSWAYWEFKYFADITTQAKPGNIESFYDPLGNLYTEKVRTLARPYATAICGKPIHTSFANSHLFQLNWEASNDCNGKRTQVFLSQRFYFNNKVVTFKQSHLVISQRNCPGCQLVQVSPSYYEVQLPADFQEGTQVLLHVLNL